MNPVWQLTTHKVVMEDSVPIFGSHPEEFIYLSWGAGRLIGWPLRAHHARSPSCWQSNSLGSMTWSPFILLNSKLPGGLDSCPIDSITNPELLLTLADHWVERAGGLIHRWHNYSKIRQKGIGRPGQVLARSKLSLLCHTSLPLRVEKK